MEFNRLCILDTETTDVYWNSCAPVQIAAIIVDVKGNELDRFNEKIKTTHAIAPDASAVHGIYEKDLRNCRKESVVLEDFCAWIVGNEVDCLLTYNGNAFDLPMLNMRCKHLNIDFKGFDLADDSYKKLDCKDDVMAAKKKDLYDLKSLGRKWKLTLVAEKLGFSTENAHDAFADVRMLRDVFFKLDPIVFPQHWKEKDSLVD